MEGSLTQPPRTWAPRTRKNVWHFDAAHAGYPVRGFCATARSFAQPLGLRQRSRHGGGCPGGNLAISAIRTLTGTVGFMSGVAGEIRPTPCTKLAAAPVEETTGVFTAT